MMLLFIPRFFPTQKKLPNPSCSVPMRQKTAAQEE
jgi:hypothetical protein